MLRSALFVTLMIMLTTLLAAQEIVTFNSPEQSKLYHSLLKEYRCLKCQNQNLADSNAGLAGDLRREIRDQILAGKNKQDIDSYLIARYGDFVLYRPPLSAKTAVLWIAPFILLVIALLSVFIMIKRQRSRLMLQNISDKKLTEIEVEKLKKARKILQN